MKKKNHIEIFISYFFKRLNLKILILYFLILLFLVVLNSFLLFDKYKNQQVTNVYIFEMPAVESLSGSQKIYFYNSYANVIEKNREESLNYCPVSSRNWDRNIFYKHETQYKVLNKEYYSLAITAIGKIGENDKKFQECVDFFISKLRNDFNIVLNLYLDGIKNKVFYLKSIEFDNYVKGELLKYDYILKMNTFKAEEVKIYNIISRYIFLPSKKYSNIIIFLIVTTLLFSFIVLKDLKLKK